MLRKKLIAEGVIVLQLITSLIGISASHAEAPSAEFNLLSSVITLRGEALSQKSLQQRLKNDIQNYKDTAPFEGREDRMQQALVQLKIMTAEQANSLRTGIDSDVQSKIGENTHLSQQENETLMDRSLQTALSNMQGAQFSACDNLEMGTTVLIVGAGVSSLLGWIYYAADHGGQKSAFGSSTAVIISVSVLTTAVIARIFEGSNCN
jgi:hypothetical protein